MGWSKNPTDPFVNKAGALPLEYDRRIARYGSCFFCDDGNQLVAGHAHIWQEDGQFYVGYDYRNHKARDEREDLEARDILGIRRMYWVHG